MNEEKVIEKDSIELEVVDKNTGKRKGTARLHARIIEFPGREPVKKQETSLQPKNVPVASDPEKDINFVFNQALQPLYDLDYLAELPERSTELSQNIRAMVTNTVGFGWQLKERPMDEDEHKKYKAQISKEKGLLSARLQAVHPTESFIALREMELYDKHSVGNGYLELIENARGELVGISHVRGHFVRLTEKDKDPVYVKVPVVRPEDGYKLDYVGMWHRFRKFVIELSTGGNIWYKEAGDPRTMNRETGEFTDKPLLDYQRATALIHNKIYNPRTPYGVPLYIGAAVAIAGSREAEEVNYNSISNNMVPSMFVVIENGALTDGSITRLTEWTEQKVARAKNRSAFIILEGEASNEGLPDHGQFRIRIEPLASAQNNDELYQKYDENNRSKVRESFRLPPLFLGRMGDYNRATSIVSKALADEQIFAPERDHNDFLVNRFILSRWGARFHVYRSNHPNITDDTELIKMMAFSERSGGMTPRRANNIMQDVYGDGLGPMPKGIDPDVPFSITFAEAQKLSEAQAKTLAQGPGSTTKDPALPSTDAKVEVKPDES